MRSYPAQPGTDYRIYYAPPARGQSLDALDAILVVGASATLDCCTVARRPRGSAFNSRVRPITHSAVMCVQALRGV